MNTKTVFEILTAARELIATPEKWTKIFRAVDSDGRLCDPSESQAVRFCAVGALHKVDPEGYERAYNALLIESGTSSVSKFNDTHTHAEVLALFDAAIARSRP